MTGRSIANAARTLALIAACSALSLTVDAEGPREAGSASGDASAAARNLQVLRKDISASELDGLMRKYDVALGVSCEYCHVQDPQTQRFDYGSDDNPKKMTARVMISMLDEINGKFLAQLSDPRYPVRFACGNCHRGQEDPPTFEPRQGPALSAR